MKKLINITAIFFLSVLLFNAGCNKTKRCKGKHFNGVVKYIEDFCEYKIELEDTLDPDSLIIHILPEKLPARLRRDEIQVEVDFELADPPFNKAVCFGSNTFNPTKTIYARLKCAHRK